MIHPAGLDHRLDEAIVIALEALAIIQQALAAQEEGDDIAANVA
jgi:hypothetical protein